MTEVLFYHLSEKRLEDVLPGLLKKCLERDWSVVVQAVSEERMQALDTHLWSWSDDGFLPHGFVRDGTEAIQPIWLTCESDNPNNAAVRFMVEGAEPPDLSPYIRGIYIFDGHNTDDIAQARKRWKIEKEAGHEVTYWQQNPRGGWDKKA
ncbi:MAG: DNA polymerase III subunit chi [Hyphomicrobiales bacterium]|nr:DNA polymerase III subunit chi [Hyphomicrobiales bacterium]